LKIVEKWIILLLKQQKGSKKDHCACVYENNLTNSKQVFYQFFLSTFAQVALLTNVNIEAIRYNSDTSF
jgi:hypothetical protein